MDDQPRMDEGRVLILARTTKDAASTSYVLSDLGLPSCCCANLQEICREVEAGAGAALLTEEDLLTDSSGYVSVLLKNQPAWSDLPLVVLMRAGQEPGAALDMLKEVAHMTLVPSPIQIAVLVSAVRAALRDRRRQYAVRDLMLERERVTAKLARDIERRKKTELRLRQSEEQLRRIAANLSESDQRKDEFLAMLAHELRNPLSAISSALHLLENPAATTEQTGTARGIAQRQVDQLRRLIDDLLDISRITGGKVQLRKQNFDLAGVAERAVEVARPLIEAHAHQLTVSLDDSCELRVHGDPARIEQVIVNLLTNAAKYTEDRGRVSLVARREVDQHVVRVGDTGVGISAEVLSKVFDLFAQAPQSLARSEGGLGIGLTLVKTLVELHGGSVSVSSTEGQGSEFVVRLPAAEPTQSTGAAEPQLAPSSGARRRVLIVDDNRESAQMQGMLLEFSGHVVELAYDGPAALQAVRHSSPEVILLDIGLPGINGYVVAEQIRQDVSLCQPLIIAVSGYGQAKDRRRSQAAGFDAHLVKPVDQMQLVKLLAGES